MTERDIGFLVGLLLGQGHFGGDGKLYVGPSLFYVGDPDITIAYRDKEGERIPYAEPGDVQYRFFEASGLVFMRLDESANESSVKRGTR